MSSDSECELMKILDNHIENLQTEEAVAALKNEKFREVVASKSWELISAISKHLNGDVTKRSPELVQCCSELLMFVAQNTNPEETVLEFIDQATCPNNDTLFIALLEPLITVHMRLSRRRCDSLKWLLNAFLSHLRSLDAPQMSGLEGSDERKLLDLDPAAVRINVIYSSLIKCLDPLIDEISHGSTEDPASFREMSTVLQVFLLRLFGSKLSLLDLSNDGKCLSEARSNVEKLMHLYARISGNIMHNLDLVDELSLKPAEKEKCSAETEDDDECDAFTPSKIPEVCYAVFYYVVIAETVDIDKIPCVYSHLYVFQCGVYLSTVLFNPKEDAHMLKGLALAKSVVEMQGDSSVPSEVLDSRIHSAFQKSVINAMIYSSSRECRTIGVKVLELYIRKFDEKGKYLVLMSMLSSAGHSGLAGFLLVQLKNIVNTFTLNGTGDQNSLKPSAYFSGQKLLALLFSKGGCTLEHGAETDILEASDQVLSALNLLRFLAIRDNMNCLGFWEHVPAIRSKFLIPLREGIDFSRAHYQVKRKDLEEQKRSGRKRIGGEPDINVKIGGMDLPNLPIDRKIMVVESALNTFDLIESLMGRLNECLELGLGKK
ncbi:glomulin [Hetaerina americana]|uniref:glomulin n=1 Tax=Hetaerina americana TaxID=62018 RepID=UPI003A7F35B8